ncbi:MAG: hypothetical protein ACJ0G4_04910 [Alphaproteobacteria bacterium]|tara:strand:- start:655 stop:1446 length:792 start_codon:yes stop_codon:yes gene_type:complete
MAEKNEGNFLIKISKVNPGSHAASNFLKPDDIIIALDNQLYTFGEKQLNQDLKELKKNQQKTIITILREETFFDLKIGNSLGCKFVTTTKEETSKIKTEFLKREFYESDELYEYIGMRDVYRNYELIENSNSLSAGIFPPIWLAYNQKWWILFLFLAIMSVTISVDIFIFFLSWLLTSIYCYKAQLNLLLSFSMLEGKVFCIKLVARSIDDAQKIVRKLDPKSKFKFSKLPQPLVEEVEKDKDKEDKSKNKENIVDENQTVVV